MNIAEEIKKLKSLKDKAEGQVEAYETQQKNLKTKYDNLGKECFKKYGCELKELGNSLQEDENKMISLVNDAKAKYIQLTDTNE